MAAALGTPAATSSTVTPESQEIDDTDVQPAKKKRGHYKTYSLEFKLSVVREVHQMGAQIGDVAEKFKVPRSTLFDWEKQLGEKILKSLVTIKVST